MSKIVTSKSEDELIATVENIVDAERCLLFAQRAMRSNMPALAAVCEARAKLLKPPRAGKATLRSAHARQLKTHSVAEQALEFLVEDYKAALSPTSYGKLVERCGFNARNNARWFGQVTGLIDAACALAGVPSFALARVREDNGEINHAAWK